MKPPTHERIEKRAYQLYLTWGRIAIWNWLTAERTLWEEYRKQPEN